MKKILNAFSKDKLQKILFLGLIVLVFGVFIVSIIISSNPTEKPKDNDDIHNNDGDKDKDEDPIKTIEKYLAPCKEAETSIMRHFYSVDSDTLTQETALIQHGSKYYISRGLTYVNENDSTFNVYASLSGTVKEVEESSLYGVSITIDHGEGIETEYIGVSNCVVSVGDFITQGQKIATSGKAEYDVAASNHVHFKISVDGTYYDPENLLKTDRN